MQLAALVSSFLLPIFLLASCNQVCIAACICSFLSHPFAIANVSAVTLPFALPPLLSILPSSRRHARAAPLLKREGKATTGLKTK
ncbi:MAG: hypothetical protein LBE57_04480 [Methanosarcinales archaeon]|nr:hypothetical protein [Methanosarcinales archaeon]